MNRILRIVFLLLLFVGTSCNKDETKISELKSISIADLWDVQVDQSTSECFGLPIGELIPSQGLVSFNQDEKFISFQINDDKFIRLVDCNDSIESLMGNVAISGRIFQTQIVNNQDPTIKTFSILPNTKIKSCLPISTNPNATVDLIGSWQIQSISTDKTVYPPCEGYSNIEFEQSAESDSIFVGGIVSLNGFSINALVNDELLSFGNELTITLGIGSPKQSEFEMAFFSIVRSATNLDLEIEQDQLELSSKNGTLTMIKN